MSPYSGQSTNVMAALWTPMKPLPSSWMDEMKSAFCWASISRSPPVKKSTASKSFRFLALYSNLFLVSASVSVRSVVLHKPVSLPSRSIVAMAWDTASCRYPFSSPMTRSCFGDDTADWAVAEDCATQTLQSATIVTKNASRRGTMVWPITSANLTAVQPASQSPQRAESAGSDSGLLGGICIRHIHKGKNQSLSCSTEPPGVEQVSPLSKRSPSARRGITRKILAAHNQRQARKGE